MLTTDGPLGVNGVGVPITPRAGSRRLESDGRLDPGDSWAALVGGAGVQPGCGEQCQWSGAWRVVYSFCHSWENGNS